MTNASNITNTPVPTEPILSLMESRIESGGNALTTIVIEEDALSLLSSTTINVISQVPAGILSIV